MLYILSGENLAQEIEEKSEADRAGIGNQVSYGWLGGSLRITKSIAEATRS